VEVARPERPAPPVDQSEGFKSLKDLKVPEKKGVTQESRNDLRAALASIAPAAVASKPVAPKPQSAATPAPQPVVVPVPTPASPPPAPPKPVPRPQPAEVPVAKDGERLREVPEDILKKILAV